MQARVIAPLLLASVAFASLVSGYLLWRSDERANPAFSDAAVARIQADAPSVVTIKAAAPSAQDDVASAPPTPQAIARWIEETNSADKRTRAAAILALANAPKSDALPTLRLVLEGGEPTLDRPLALQSLRDLALYQGDGDGTIRTVVREAIYHGDDDAFVEQAQLALELIEESEMGAMQ